MMEDRIERYKRLKNRTPDEKWADDGAPRARHPDLENALREFISEADERGIDGGLVPAARDALRVLEEVRREVAWPFLPAVIERPVYFWAVLAALVKPELPKHGIGYIEKLAYWWSAHQGLGCYGGEAAAVFGEYSAAMSDAAIAWLAASDVPASPFWREARRRGVPVWDPMGIGEP